MSRAASISGFVETGGVVSIEAAHYARAVTLMDAAGYRSLVEG